MKIVSKSNTELVFETLTDRTYSSNHTWTFFGSPFATPRDILPYITY